MRTQRHWKSSLGLIDLILNKKKGPARLVSNERIPIRCVIWTRIDWAIQRNAALGTTYRTLRWEKTTQRKEKEKTAKKSGWLLNNDNVDFHYTYNDTLTRTTADYGCSTRIYCMHTLTRPQGSMWKTNLIYLIFIGLIISHRLKLYTHWHGGVYAEIPLNFFNFL